MATGPISEAFLACRRRLARVISRIVPPQDIEDIVQETYVRVCEYVARNRVDEPRALMLTVARNLALDHVKRSEYRLTRRLESESDIESILARDATDEAFNEVASHQEFSQFCDAVRHLPVQCRRVFILKKVYGYSQREIAQELGIAESTVEKHIATGLQLCVRHMQTHAKSRSVPAGDHRRTAGPRGRP